MASVFLTMFASNSNAHRYIRMMSMTSLHDSENASVLFNCKIVYFCDVVVARHNG